jgi:hypothetical protein
MTRGVKAILMVKLRAALAAVSGPHGVATAAENRG